MTQTASEKRRKEVPVQKLIEQEKEKMQVSGRFHFICPICGKRGPKYAERDKASGQLVILADAHGLDKWPIKVVPAEGKMPLTALSFGCVATAFTTIRLCPVCARKNN